MPDHSAKGIYMITLYHYWRSSCSYRVRWALHHKKIPFTSVKVDLLKGESRKEPFISINPLGMIPALKFSNGNILCDSWAILEYLEECYPQNPLLPRSSIDRATVRRLAQMIHSFTQPLGNLRVQSYVNSQGMDGLAFAKHWMIEGLGALEKSLQKTAGTYCYGAQLSLADICLIPQMYNAVRFQVDTRSFSTIERIYQNCLILPACVAASPEKNQ
jgi:maleylacetoacetate isomerase